MLLHTKNNSANLFTGLRKRNWVKICMRQACFHPVWHTSHRSASLSFNGKHGCVYQQIVLLHMFQTLMRFGFDFFCPEGRGGGGELFGNKNNDSAVSF